MTNHNSNGKKRIMSTITFKSKRPKLNILRGMEGIEEITSGFLPIFVSYKRGDNDLLTAIIFFDRNFGTRTLTPSLRSRVSAIGQKLLGKRGLEVSTALQLIPISHPVLDLGVCDLITNRGVLDNCVLSCLKDIALVIPDYASTPYITNVPDLVEAIRDLSEMDEKKAFTTPINTILNRYIFTGESNHTQNNRILKGKDYVVYPLTGGINIKESIYHV